MLGSRRCTVLKSQDTVAYLMQRYSRTLFANIVVPV